MDPEACLKAIVEAMTELRLRESLPPSRRMGEEEQDMRDEISETMQNLAGWIERGGYCPDPDGWRTK